MCLSVTYLTFQQITRISLVIIAALEHAFAFKDDSIFRVG